MLIYIYIIILCYLWHVLIYILYINNVCRALHGGVACANIYINNIP